MYRYRFCGVCKNVEKYNNSNPYICRLTGVGVAAVIEAMYVQRYDFFLSADSLTLSI